MKVNRYLYYYKLLLFSFCLTLSNMALYAGDPVKPNTLVVNFDSTNNVSCYNGFDGLIYIEIIEGTPPYSFMLDNGFMDSGIMNSVYKIDSLSAGTYQVTVMDSENETVEGTITITQPDPMIMATIMTSTSVTCNGWNDGEIILGVPVGGEEPYNYSWSNGEMGPFLISQSDLAADFYAITITDSENNCTVLSTVLESPNPIILEGTSIDISCDGFSDGAIIIHSVTNGVGGLTFELNNVPITEGIGDTIPNLTEGEQILTIIDSIGCSVRDTFIIEVSLNALSIEFYEVIQPSCNGLDNGSIISITPTGGSGTYTYDWEGNIDTTMLGADSYLVTITDVATGCEGVDTVVVGEPNPLSIIEGGNSNLLCFGDQNGSLSVNTNGGTSPYTYNWSNGGTTAMISNLPADTYMLTITDANSCDTILTFNVKQPETALVASISGEMHLQCNGDTDGSAIVAAVGGTQPYEMYEWSSGETTQTAMALGAGTNMVTVTDFNGCTATAVTTINAPPLLTVEVEEATPIPCEENGQGALIAVAMGGIGTYTYTWEGDTISSSDEALFNQPGEYGVTITDQNNCTTMGSTMLTIENLPPITAITPTSIPNNEGVEIDFLTGGNNEAFISWVINNTTNIDLNAPGYKMEDMGNNPFIFSFELQDTLSPGLVEFEVYFELGECTSEMATFVLAIEPSEKELFIPEVFNPTIDEWVINIPDDPDNYSILIFSRSGTKVYDADTISAFWTAAGCPDGTYYYILTDKSTDTVYRGAISVLR